MLGPQRMWTSVEINGCGQQWLQWMTIQARRWIWHTDVEETVGVLSVDVVGTSVEDAVE